MNEPMVPICAIVCLICAVIEIARSKMTNLLAWGVAFLSLAFALSTLKALL